MGKIYTKEGWINWDWIMADPSVIKMGVGARAVGKTYGLFKWLIKNKKKFIYLRRLRTQLDLCATDAGNPFNKISADLGIPIVPTKKEGLVYFHYDNKDGEVFCLGLALSTLATVRGVDFSEYDYIIFDEAVAMIGERPIKNEFNTLLNLYETINRNRGIGNLDDRSPVVLVLLGNANKLSNPYYTGWKFTRIAVRMIKGGQMVYRTADGSRLMLIFLNSPISNQKAETAIYKNASKDFIEMALDNAFRIDSTKIRPEPLKEYRHLVSVGELGIYRHKSERKYYVCGVVQNMPYYHDYGIYLKMFVQDYFMLRINYMTSKNVLFEDYESELIFRDYFDLN